MSMGRCYRPTITLPGVTQRSIADARYVSFTSYRRDGRAVSTPVWIAPLPDGAIGFTTESEAWKVKRVRNDARVTVQPCTVRGKVLEGTSAISGTATVETGDGYAVVEAAIGRKYGLQFRMVMLSGWIKEKFSRGSAGDAAIRIVLDA